MQTDEHSSVSLHWNVGRTQIPRQVDDLVLELPEQDEVAVVGYVAPEDQQLELSLRPDKRRKEGSIRTELLGGKPSERRTQIGTWVLHLAFGSAPLLCLCARDEEDVLGGRDYTKVLDADGLKTSSSRLLCVDSFPFVYT